MNPEKVTPAPFAAIAKYGSSTTSLANNEHRNTIIMPTSSIAVMNKPKDVDYSNLVSFGNVHISLFSSI